MLNYYKDFLLNLFIIFIPLVLYPYTYKMHKKPSIHRWLMYVYFTLTLIFSMAFPVNVNGLIYDMRSVLLTVGSVYGGLPISIWLYATVIVYRFILGSPNNLIYALSLLPTLFIMYVILKTYDRLTLYKKIAAAIVACSLIKCITFTLYLSLTDTLNLLYVGSLSVLMSYAFQAVITGIYVYLIELIRKYFYMQEEIVKSERIKVVSEMAASVAHEIRNPLTVVRGFIQLLGTSGADEKRKEFYQKICLEELDRAQLIITDYLSLAKPEPDLIELIDMKDEMVYVSNVLSTYALYNNVQVHATSNDNVPVYIAGDRYKLRQALVNIGKNAIEAMSGGGELSFQLRQHTETAVVTVSDTGVGMTPEQLGRLGSPYFSTKNKGTGLGTMVSFSIIRNMDGKIDIQSEVGKGTVYYIAFPIKHKPDNIS
ncbi:ATP-binding protein [Paenibacillus thalictri]|uniref:histidine kinase n=1 Tax=Paenibacillus thalictri TaxID=2527873 RepID=A0A4Q9DL36_9BACL|nr:ATP-binding protein [Paenibacillus thalictri]TBL75083.1 hypothetical protein EYB31_24035 [Paenibacillus thalictri]